jgi:hypothetical protein
VCKDRKDLEGIFVMVQGDLTVNGSMRDVEPCDLLIKRLA